MKKLYLISLLITTIFSTGYAQTITISTARSKPSGTVVTVKGIVTNGSALGTVRYMQDNTGGIAVYDAQLSNVNRGDSITVTGKISPYANLIEIGSVSNLVINSTGNTLPDPALITADQISEPYESQLVQVKHVVFDNGGQTFAGKTSYSFTADGKSGIVYINTADQDMVGTTIPSVPVTLTAICSQHDYTDPNGGYQLLPRDLNDIVRESSIYFTKPLTNTNYTKTSMDFSWSTNITGTTGLFYGSSETGVRTNLETGTGSTLDHSVSLSGLDAGSIVWVQAFSVNGSDTAKSLVTPYATISNSTGSMKVYFNTPVDTKYSTGTDASYSGSLDDTLVKYINNAKYTIDMAIYNLNNSGIANISAALVSAANRGVTVRVVGDGTTANLGFDFFSGTDVHYIKRPTSLNGIMHNKFVVIDANSTNPDDPILWTGSMNLTEEQVHTDANNVIIIQDQSLAKAYQIEFEEMWGSTGATADASNAKFGPEKTDNTPHHFMINGDSVECYFSPTDGVNSQIINHINTTNHDLEIATMLLTRDEIATAIKTAKTDGADVSMLTDKENNNAATVNATLSAALGSHYVFWNTSGIMHNKYMIVDEGDATSNPMVWTGSHNWSAAANNDNDENSLVIHDATIANMYYQNFMHIYLAAGGVTAVRNFIENQQVQGIEVYPNPVVNGNLTVSCNFSQGASDGTLQLIDMTGRTVFNRSVSLTNGTNKLSYTFPASYKGTYVMRLITANHVWSKIVLFE